MGRGNDDTSVVLRKKLPASFTAKEREMRSLSGLSRKVFALASEEDMKSFRASLFRQSPLWMRRALLQFRREDLSLKERDILHQDDLDSLKNEELSSSLLDVSKRDADVASYLAALYSLQGRSPFADDLIDRLFCKAQEEVSQKEAVVIDVSQIEIILAACSENRWEEKLSRSLEGSRDAFTKHNIPFPDKTNIFLLPPFVSAMASNCDQTALTDKGLRSGRYYPESDTILITDDRTIIEESLLMHELLHAIQGEIENASPSLTEEEEEKATFIFETLTERLVEQLCPTEYFYPTKTERDIWRKLEKRLDEKTLKQISLLPKEELINSLAETLYPEENNSLAKLLEDLS